MRYLLLLLLAGCATKAPTTTEVKIPVYTPCVKAVPAKPEFEFDKLTPAASDGEKVLALARDWLRGRKYEGEQAAVIEGCR
jgi:hypothetical protein